ncbi:MAG: FHA domain-containing protein [Planctomycetes bacterium]|nr:FHA domain-containing protein [Planctomycetota bacterium]
MPVLHVLQGPDKGRTYNTPDESTIIGRSTDQVHLSDNSASRRHAELRPETGHWLIVDLNSSNGTFLNGQRVLSPTCLKDGDQIRVGSSLLVFTGQDASDGFRARKVPQDLVDLEGGSGSADSSILAAVNTSEDSVIIQPPETADAVAAWNLVYKIAELIGAAPSIDVFLNRVCDLILEHLVIDHLIVLTRPGPDDDLEPHIVRARTKDRTGKKKVVASRTIINHVLETRDGVLCGNVLTDDRFKTDNPLDSIHELGSRSIICVPIIARDEVRGIFHFDCSMSHHTYSQEQLRLAVAIGRLTGFAIINAELVQSLVRNERLAATGQTVAYLSHHIRNILQGLQSGTDVVEVGLKRSDLNATRSGWPLVRRNVERIYQLAMNLLTFSKDRNPKVELIQLNRIVEDAVSLVQDRADERSIMLLHELEELPAVPCDAEGAHQAIQNILLNAIDASPRKEGRINIRSRYDPDDGYVVLSIHDNGKGIPSDALEGIFDAFVSGKGHGGTGIGLAAAKKIMDEMNGRIDVESVVDQGTTFHLRFHVEHVRLADSADTHGPGQS